MKKFIAIILILSTLAISAPSPAKADIIGSTFKCTIATGIPKALPYILMAMKLASLGRLLNPNGIIPLVGTGVTNTVEYAQIAKALFFDGFARCAARAFSDQMAFNIVDIIQHGGVGGQPLVVTDWRNYITNSQYRGEMIFRLAAASTPVCDYLRNPLNQTFRISSKFKIPIKGINLRVSSLDPYQLKARCTLPDGFDFTKYQTDFAGQGGWSAFDRLLEPQNNIYGLALLSQDELNRQRSLEEQAALSEVQANNGYQGVRGSCLTPSPTGGCAVYGYIKTPGSAINAQYQAATQANFDWATSVHTLQDLVTQALMQKLTTQLTDLVSGSNPSSGTIDPNLEPTPPPVNTTLPSVTPIFTLPPSNTSTPPPGGGGGGTGDCKVLNPTDDPFGALVKAAIAQIVAAGGILDPNDSTGPFSFKILPGQAPAYHSRMEQLLTTGTVHAHWDGEEMNIYQEGNTSSDQYKIDFSNGYTTSKHKASGCPII